MQCLKFKKLKLCLKLKKMKFSSLCLKKKTMSGWLSSTILSPSSSRDTESMSGENTNAMSEIEKNEVENNVDI